METINLETSKEAMEFANGAKVFVPVGSIIERSIHVMTIPCDTESIMDLLVKTDADWNEVLRFLAVYADKQGIHIASQTIADKVRERLGTY